MVKESLSLIGEFGLIDLIKRNIKAGPSVIVGIGDDTAVVRSNKYEYQLLTTDILIEGTHFSSNDDLMSIGNKAISCSVSDIAAMGGMPQYALISLGINPKLKVSDVQALYKGLQKSCHKFNVTIVGGDTVKNAKLIINVALVGNVRKSRLILRSTAQQGDLIFLTGRVGGSYKSKRHLTFTPRLKESQCLAGRYKPTSMIDISDGLIQDLNHILKASAKGAVVYEDKIPIHADSNLNGALYDGEDFELIFTLPKIKAEQLLKDQCLGFKPYLIGEIMDIKSGFYIQGKNGTLKKTVSKGFTHF